MVEQKRNSLSVFEQTREVIKGTGLMLKLAFDPRTDPLLVDFFKSKKPQIKQEEMRGNNG